MQKPMFLATSKNFLFYVFPQIALKFRKHYICEAMETVYATRFVYTAPFVIIDVGRDQSLMTELPDPLYIGQYT